MAGAATLKTADSTARAATLRTAARADLPPRLDKIEAPRLDKIEARTWQPGQRRPDLDRERSAAALDAGVL
jgi:hypothetical protein